MSVAAYNTYNNYMTCYGNEEYNDGRCTAKTVRKADTVSGRTSDAALKVSAGDTSDTAFPCHRDSSFELLFQDPCLASARP